MLTLCSFAQLIQAGKGEALRIRAILRSLVPIEDLVGVISLPVQLPSYGKGRTLVQHRIVHVQHAHVENIHMFCHLSKKIKIKHNYSACPFSEFKVV